VTHHHEPIPTNQVRNLRIAIDELPARETERGDAIDVTLKRLGAPVGSACQVDCDCEIGLVCAAGICSQNE
jgi:hypothetical protein